jgi:hypothetical protein
MPFLEKTHIITKPAMPRKSVIFGSVKFEVEKYG